MAQIKEKLETEVIEKLKFNQAQANEAVVNLGQIELRIIELKAELDGIQKYKEDVLKSYKTAVDVMNEEIAVLEAIRLGIPTFAMVDTNSDPSKVDFAIPANDDAFKSVSLLVKAFGTAIEEGLSERKKDKDDAKLSEEEEAKRAVDAETQE
jgi:small subunit ribosomal protein S2